jgi:hypothetical protein
MFSIKDYLFSSPQIKNAIVSGLKRSKDTIDSMTESQTNVALATLAGCFIRIGLPNAYNGDLFQGIVQLCVPITAYICQSQYRKKASIYERCRIIIQKDIIQNLPIPKDCSKPVVLILTGKSDDNGALRPTIQDIDQFSKMRTKYELVFRQISKFSDIEKHINDTVANRHEIAGIWINAHGSPSTIYINEDQNNNEEVTSENLSKIADSLKKVTRFVLLATCCNAQKKESSLFSIADHFVKHVSPGVTVIGALNVMNTLEILNVEPLKIGIYNYLGRSGIFSEADLFKLGVPYTNYALELTKEGDRMIRTHSAEVDLFGNRVPNYPKWVDLVRRPVVLALGALKFFGPDFSQSQVRS